MVLNWTRRAVWWRSDKDRCVRRRRVVGVEEDRWVAFCKAGFKADDPCEAAGLGDEEGDQKCVFHIGVVGCWVIKGREWEGLGGGLY